MNKKSVVSLLVVWFLIICSSLIWNIYLIKLNNKKIILNKSKSFFEQIVVTWLWNSNHNGVYVQTTHENPPNEFLVDSLRDVVTTEGMKLTKINPSYMTRQISEINKKDYNIQFHITSLNPIRPANKADEWETQALKSFEKGTKEMLELTKQNTGRQFRYMAPLITQQSCLTCHAVQGYKLGEIRGGISVSFPAGLYLALTKKQIFSMVIIHFLIFFIGFTGVILFNKRLTSAYDKIKIKNSELTEINATKDKFFSIIAHDLRSPFNSIVGLSNYLVENINEKNYTETEKFANLILQSSDKAMGLLSNLMVWAQAQSGKLEFNPEFFEIGPLVKENIQLLNGIAEQKSIVIKNAVSIGLKGYADKEMINTIIRNLLSNALKFTGTNGKIVISGDDSKPDFITVRISDEGVGISPERIGKIFDITENHSTPGTHNEKGTGLGLILCKEFITKNNGKIWVESTQGAGSTFSFSLPKSGPK